MSDAFVRDMLKKWDLGALIDDFREADIDKRALHALADNNTIVDTIIKSPGKRAIFLFELRKMMSQSAEEAEVERPTSSASTVIVENESEAVPQRDPLISPDTAVFLTQQDATLGLQEKPGKKRTQMCYVPYPAPLPQLTAKLEAAEKSGTLKSSFLDFVKLHGNHLLGLTSGKLSAADYQNYSQTLIQRYPALKDNSHGKQNASLSQALSHFVRNAKYNLKRKLSTTTGATKKPNIHQSMNIAETAVSNSENNNVSELLEELKKCQGNTAHSRLLLKNTYAERRAIIVNADLAQIMQQFPILKNLDLLLYELSLTIPMENIQTRFTKVVNKLQAIFQPPHIEEVHEEVRILNLFELLLKRLHPVGTRGTRALLTVTRAGKEVDLAANGLLAPCAAVFVGDGGITDTFFLVEGEIWLHEKYTAAKSVILVLIGMYFVFDRHYPTAYHSFLRFLETEVLGVVEKPLERGTLTFRRFMDAYRQ